MKKEIIFLINILFCVELVLGLGLSPGRQYADFQPGLELEYAFHVSTSPSQKIVVYAEEEFADLVRFDRTEFVGNGDFTVKIKLPNKIEKPGRHRILIAAAEKIEQLEGGVMTRIVVRAPITIMVPYPGKYAEIGFSSHNVNAGESVKFEVKVLSLGHEAILAKTDVEIYSNDEKIETLSLGSAVVENQAKETFIGYLNTTSYKPGYYKAVAVVDYEEGLAKAESGFRIGHLFVNITNYTREIKEGGIKSFEIHIESLWNNPIDSVGGEVSLFRGEDEVLNFLTPSISIEPWEEETLLGYVDTEKVEIGIYDTEMILNYGNKTLVQGELRIKREINQVYIIGAILSIVILALVIALVYLIVKFKNVKNKK